MIGACGAVLLVVEAIIGDLADWETIVIAATAGGTVGLVRTVGYLSQPVLSRECGAPLPERRLGA